MTGQSIRRNGINSRKNPFGFCGNKLIDLSEAQKMKLSITQVQSIHMQIQYFFQIYYKKMLYFWIMTCPLGPYFMSEKYM